MLAQFVACSLGVQAPIHLAVRPVQTELIVGEPLKLVLAFEARTTVELRVPQEEDGYRPLKFWIDDGSGSREYFEYATGPSDDVGAPRVLNPGEQEIVNVVLAYGRYSQPSFPFPDDGKYAMRVQYATATACADSNVVSFTVMEPMGEAERRMHAALHREPLVLKVARGYEERAEAWVAADTRNRYLRWPRLKLIIARAEEISTGFLRAQRDQQPRSSRMDDHKREYFTKTAEDLVGEDWGPFEEERLALIAKCHRWSGRRMDADVAERELLERFPGSAAARQILQRRVLERELNRILR